MKLFQSEINHAIEDFAYYVEQHNRHFNPDHHDTLSYLKRACLEFNVLGTSMLTAIDALPDLTTLSQLFIKTLNLANRLGVNPAELFTEHSPLPSTDNVFNVALLILNANSRMSKLALNSTDIGGSFTKALVSCLSELVAAILLAADIDVEGEKISLHELIILSKCILLHEAIQKPYGLRKLSNFLRDIGKSDEQISQWMILNIDNRLISTLKRINGSPYSVDPYIDYIERLRQALHYADTEIALTMGYAKEQGTGYVVTEKAVTEYDFF